MAKFETIVRGGVDEFLDFLSENRHHLGSSVSLEDSSRFGVGDIEVGVVVLERYSYFGGNRVSLNITCVQSNQETKIVAITAGGSQAMFMKINTIGEESFLDKFVSLVNSY